MKPASAKAKGRDAENEVARGMQYYMRTKVERRAKNGAFDRGDISGVANVVVEVKSRSKFSPLQWIRELRAEIANDHAQIGFVAMKTTGSTKFDDYLAIMPMPEFMELLNDAGWVDHLPGEGPLPDGWNDPKGPPLISSQREPS